MGMSGARANPSAASITPEDIYPLVMWSHVGFVGTGGRS